MNVCFEKLGGMCTLFYENRLGIRKNWKFVHLFCTNSSTKVSKPYHSNHVIPHCVDDPFNGISFFGGEMGKWVKR